MSNASDVAKARAGGLAPALGERTVLLWSYAATICLSAFLLFSVQPLFARLVLPKLGGSPSVWAVSMCFFQAVLLAGYCYAHLLNRSVAGALGSRASSSSMGAACLALPVAAARFGLWEPPRARPTSG